MDPGLVLAIGLALAFAMTNGLHDASDAVATLVATRAAKPSHAIAMASAFSLIGPFVIGAAVANTIAGIVTVPAADTTAVIGAGLAAASLWNLVTLRLGLPSSSGNALVGGLVGAALIEGGVNAIQWGGLDGLRPVGVIGTVVALAISPPLGALAALFMIRLLRRLARRLTRRWRGPINGGQWAMSAALAFSHGANDAQKSVGVIVALLLAAGEIHSLTAPTWAVVSSAVALTLGTSFGGWKIIRTVGRGIYRIQPIEGLASESSSAAVIFGASLLGGPVSTTQVVASSLVGIGAGRGRLHHVHWHIFRRVAFAWLVTIPVTAALAMAAYGIWQLFA